MGVSEEFKELYPKLKPEIQAILDKDESVLPSSDAEKAKQKLPLVASDKEGLEWVLRAYLYLQEMLEKYPDCFGESIWEIDDDQYDFMVYLTQRKWRKAGWKAKNYILPHGHVAERYKGANAYAIIRAIEETIV